MTCQVCVCILQSQLQTSAQNEKFVGKVDAATLQQFQDNDSRNMCILASALIYYKNNARCFS